jgi:phytoene dehydrogenase-like protein
MTMSRGRLSNIDLLPEACSPTLAWAVDALQDRDRTQMDIYAEFVAKLEAVAREHRGELEIKIPSFTAFNRYSVKLAVMTRRLDETREIATAIASKFDAQASDDLTLIAAEAIKTLIFELLTSKGESGIDPKGAMALANALRAATQAQGVSFATKQKVKAEFAANAKEAVASVVKLKGLSSEGAKEILDKILGVET